MTRIGNEPRVLIDLSQVDNKKDRELLSKVAGLDGDASSVSELDLEILANPDLDAPSSADASKITAADLYKHNRVAGGKIIEGPGASTEGQRLMQLLGDGLAQQGYKVGAGNKSITLPKKQESAVADPSALVAALGELGLASNPIYSARLSRLGGQPPERLETQSVTVDASGNGKAELQALLDAGFVPITAQSGTVPTGVQREELNAALGDLFITGAYTPDPGKLDELGTQFEAMLADGYRLEDVVIHSGTDAQPVSRALFERMAHELVFSGKLEAMGFDCPYGMSWEQLRDAPEADRPALMDKMLAWENANQGFGGNHLLALARNCGVREFLANRFGDAITFATPVLTPSVPGHGTLRNPSARFVDVQYSRTRDIAESSTVTTYTLARFDPLQELKSTVAIGFDVSGSVTAGEKALFLRKLHEQLTAQGYESVQLDVVFFSATGMLASNGQLQVSGTPDQAVAELARRVLRLSGTLSDEEVLAQVAAMAQQNDDAAFDYDTGEMGTTSGNAVPPRLMALRNAAGGPDKCSILMMTDIDPGRMATLARPPFGFVVYNPALD